MAYVLVNNEIKKTAETNLSSFLWNSPSLFRQKIWFGYGGIPLFDENLANLKEQLVVHGFEQPPLFRQPRELFRLCKRTLNKNKLFRSGHINFQLFASETHTQLLVTTEPREIFDFPLSDNGLLVRISELRKSSSSPLEKFSGNNDKIWQAAKHQLKNTSFNGALLLNEKGFVCEGLGANIFLLKDNMLITPSPESGCYIDVLRNLIVSLATSMGVKVLQSDEIPKEMLFVADEIFMASEANGIEWILGLNSKRFIRSFSLELHEKINALLKQKSSLQ